MRSTTPRTSSPRELLTVDLCGLKAALHDKARARGVPVSLLVREALVRDGLGTAPHFLAAAAPDDKARGSRVRVSLRLAPEQARALGEAAKAAGRPVGRYVVELMQRGRPLPSQPERLALAAALAQSNAGLSTLTRYIGHLRALLARGEVRAVQQYLPTLDSLDGTVRAHLAGAAKVLAELSSR